ncbi:MAG: DUF4394 domain-containing protein [Patulibacter sp.]
MSITRHLAIVAAPLALAIAAPAGASAATAFYGVTSDNELVTFQSDNTTTVPALPIQGLRDGERVIGLDLRPADLRLYGLTNKNRFVVINPRTAAVRYVGEQELDPALTGDRASLNFDPVRDRIQVETTAGQNLRIDPSTGQLDRVTVTPTPTATPADTTATTTPTPTATDAPGQPLGVPAYASGDAGAGTTPKLAAIAFTNSFPVGTTTQLFALDAARNTVVRQEPIDDGVLHTVGTLGTNGSPVAFDIADDNAGYAAITTTAGGTRVGLYRVNLSDGKASAVGSNFVIGSSASLVALAAAGTVANDTSRPGLSVSSSSTQLRSRLLAGGVQLTVNCDEACAGTAKVKYAGRTAGTSDAEVSGGAGYDRVAVALDSRTRTAIRRPQGARLTLLVAVTDGAGNRSTLSRTIRTR